MKASEVLTFLINPFTKIAGWKAFGIGIVIVCVTVLIAYANGIFFNGALDTHFMTDRSLSMAFIYQAVALFSMVLVMYLISLPFAKSVRFQDVLGTVTLARFPFMLTAFTGFLLNAEQAQDVVKSLFVRSFDHPHLFIFVLVTFLMLCTGIWYIALLYNAFRVSTDIKGGKSVGLIILIVLLAETLSLVANYFIGNVEL